LENVVGQRINRRESQFANLLVRNDHRCQYRDWRNGAGCERLIRLPLPGFALRLAGKGIGREQTAQRVGKEIDALGMELQGEKLSARAGEIENATPHAGQVVHVVQVHAIERDLVIGERHRNLDEAVAPERQHAVALLRWGLDMKETEIAAALQIAEGTVSSHLHKVRRQLLRQLGPDYPFGNGGPEGASS
jgi:hypothetical protein